MEKYTPNFLGKSILSKYPGSRINFRKDFIQENYVFSVYVPKDLILTYGPVYKNILSEVPAAMYDLDFWTEYSTEFLIEGRL